MKRCLPLWIYRYWGNFNEVSLLEKEDFYSPLTMKDITDADYAHVKEVCKDFKIKKLGYYIIMIYMFKAIHCC